MATVIRGSILDTLQENTDLVSNLFSLRILKGVQVLIVDNDNDSGKMYDVLLNDFGAIVTLSGSVKDALEILDWLIPSIIVCEIRFLGESIYRLIEKLQAIEAVNGNHIPILITSTCSTGSYEEIPDVEFEGYLLKPFDPEELVLTIANLIQVCSNNSIVS